VIDGVPCVLLVDGVYEDYDREEAARHNAAARFVRALPPAESEAAVLALDELPSAHVLLVELAPITRKVLSRATSCRAVIRYGTGIDNIDTAAAKQLGIDVLNVAGYAADSVADHVLGLTLAIARRLLPSREVVLGGKWRGDPRIARPLGLRGRTLGLLGYGAIGAAVAQRALAFGMTVLAHDPYITPEEAPPGVKMCGWEKLLTSSDVLSLHLPLTDATSGIIDATALAQMKASSILINTARGGLVNEAALLAALSNDRLSFAALDVWNFEPPAHDDPVRRHPKILLTPHIGFWSDQSEAALRARVIDLALAALSRANDSGDSGHRPVASNES
jgi:D-3-phosphoglycerate dehydrogenase